MMSLDLLGMISRAVKPMDIAVEIVDQSGGWGMERTEQECLDSQDKTQRTASISETQYAAKLPVPQTRETTGAGSIS